MVTYQNDGMLPVSSDLNEHILYNSGKYFLISTTTALKQGNIISLCKLKVSREITIQEAQNPTTDKAKA